MQLLFSIFILKSILLLATECAQNVRGVAPESKKKACTIHVFFHLILI